MRLPRRRRPAADALSGLFSIALVSALLTGLYVGQDVVIPLALAALITFLLSPMVNRLERWIGNVAAVLATITLVLGVVVMLGWTLGRQAVDLANEAPRYEENIRTKLRGLKSPHGGTLDRLSQTVEDLKRELPGNGRKADDTGDFPGSDDVRPVPVEIVAEPESHPLETIRAVAGPIMGPLGTAALVSLLATFMLLKREDLAGRLLRLIGQGRISATTRAMNDAGTRVRRYLLMQLVVNVTYGIPLAIGLYFIGVPNALLWGALAAVLRFIPYLGPWIAASFPILLSLAVSPDWTMPLMTIGLFVVLELVSNNVIEPWLYGSSTGVSTIALIVSAVFWTWMWGAAGLMLSTPITVCLVVMGRHIPQLAFLSVVLGEDQALTPAEDCYHRLLRKGEHDETELAETFLQTRPLVELYDSMMIPVIRTAEEDYLTGSIDAEQREQITGALGDLIDDLGESAALPPTDAEAPVDCEVVCLATRAERDALAAAMSAQVLRQRGFTARHLPAKHAIGEMLHTLETDAPDLVCLSVIPPTRPMHARHLIQKIRRTLPQQKIIVGLWGRQDEDLEDDIKLLREAGAEEVVTSIAAFLAHSEKVAECLTEVAFPVTIPADEEERLITLDQLGLVNADREPVLDHLTSKLARLLDAPVTAITLVDRERQWFKSHIGLPQELADEGETPRDLSICGHVVGGNKTVVIRDLKRDRRFANHPMLQRHGIRFYAGSPIRAANGQPVGALCVMDLEPRTLSATERRLLETNAAEVADELARMADHSG
jgi:predicted PurR-regulated permease PerM/GAF domain-containing protein